MRVSLQLFTVRNELSADLSGTLKAIAATGLKFVEGGGQSPSAAKEWKALLDENGLKMSGAHYGLAAMEDLDGLAEAMNILECKTLINPWDQASHFQSEDAVKAYAEKLNIAGEQAKSVGLEYLYHNHDFEFVKLGDKTAYDLLLELTDPTLVNYEVDVAWVKIGGADETEILTRYVDRVGALHLKDFDPSQTPRWRVAGQGVVNLDFCLDFATKNNIPFGSIELDESPIAPLEAVAESFKFFAGKGYN
jgi:sugar phosphate isomerase/epimerase